MRRWGRSRYNLELPQILYNGLIHKETGWGVKEICRELREQFNIRLSYDCVIRYCHGHLICPPYVLRAIWLITEWEPLMEWFLKPAGKAIFDLPRVRASEDNVSIPDVMRAVAEQMKEEAHVVKCVVESVSDEGDAGAHVTKKEWEDFQKAKKQLLSALLTIEGYLKRLRIGLRNV
ncbi:hypothetical protein J7M23_08145 [Candidatus Sumerlaeota bacterium]|nr:hypothetical protein [Candidatus Sumerlaeota bacterium]